MSSKKEGGTPRTMTRKKSLVLPATVKDNISAKTIKILGDKQLMPRAARERLGSSLSGQQLHAFLEEMHRLDKQEEEEKAINAILQKRSQIALEKVFDGCGDDLDVLFGIFEIPTGPKV